MATTLNSSGVLFPDGTTQTTAASAGRGGTTSTTSGTNITLTSSSTQQQLIKFTAGNLSVSLPNATTLSNSTNTFQIKNTGTELVTVKDYDGNVLCFVTGSVSLSLVGNSASAGVWMLNDLDASWSPQQLSTAASSSAVPGSSPYSDYASVIMLTSTTGVVSWIAITGVTWWVRAFTISGGVVTFGTGVALPSSGGIPNVSVNGGMLTRLSDTLCVAAVTDSSTSQFAWACTVSGTTITAGSRITLASNSASGVDFNIVRASDTAFLYQFNLNTTGKMNIKYCSVSGTTITVGAAQASTLGGNYAVMGLTYNGSGCILTASGYVGFTLSGSTVTFASPTADFDYSFAQVYYKSSASFSDATEPNRVYVGPFVVDMSGSTITSLSTRLWEWQVGGTYYRNTSGQVKLIFPTYSSNIIFSVSASPQGSSKAAAGYVAQENGVILSGFSNSKYMRFSVPANIAVSGTQAVRLVGTRWTVSSTSTPIYIETAKILS